jgi:methylmalonyl-CoA mutase
MSKLGQVVEAVEKYNRFVLDQVKRARADEKFGRELINRWNETKEKTPVTHTPTGLPLPRLALPEIDEPGEIARYLFGEGLPGAFPFLNGAYREMYLEPARGIELSSYEKDGDKNDVAAGVSPANRSKVRPTRPPLQEEPTRLFSGLMLAEDTNERFHYLTQHQRTHRLSTAFDGPTLYGIDSDADGVSGKIGEGGVAIDTVEDMMRLYDGFDLGSPNFSASMTISGPAPIIMAMYIAAAKRRFGPKGRNCAARFRPTFSRRFRRRTKLFSHRTSLRFLTDMVEFTTHKMPLVSISISGYHIGEAGSTPVQRAAYTLSNGFAYVGNVRRARDSGRSIRARLSFFLDCGLDAEYIMARVSRRIWAIGMRDAYGADLAGSYSNCTPRPAAAR